MRKRHASQYANFGSLRSFRTEGRQTELTENQGVIADDVHHIDQHRDQHRINSLVGAPQGSGNCQ